MLVIFFFTRLTFQGNMGLESELGQAAAGGWRKCAFRSLGVFCGCWALLWNIHTVQGEGWQVLKGRHAYSQVIPKGGDRGWDAVDHGAISMMTEMKESGKVIPTQVRGGTARLYRAGWVGYQRISQMCNV